MFLSLKDVSKHFTSSNGKILRHILKGVHLEMARYEKIAIVGPSGAGKTTLLNLIGTLDKADSGQIIFRDKDLSKLRKKEVLRFRNKQIGFIFQLHHLLPQCTLWENVLIPSLPNKRNEGLRTRAEHLLKSVGIWGQRHQLPGEMSGGECQRAAVVRALINQPSLLLADEPTGALDEDNGRKLMQLLLDLNAKEQTSMIVVSHAMEIAELMDKVYLLKNGHLHRIK